MRTPGSSSLYDGVCFRNSLGDKICRVCVGGLQDFGELLVQTFHESQHVSMDHVRAVLRLEEGRGESRQVSSLQETHTYRYVDGIILYGLAEHHVWIVLQQSHHLIHVKETTGGGRWVTGMLSAVIHIH